VAVQRADEIKGVIKSIVIVMSGIICRRAKEVGAPVKLGDNGRQNYALYLTLRTQRENPLGLESGGQLIKIVIR